MRTFLFAFATISVLTSAANAESPFACNRLALTREQRQRHFDELGPKLRALVLQAREVADGYEIQFPGDAPTLQLLAEWTAGEHLCCPFFDIDLRLEREAGTAWIRLTGRPATKEFIRSDFKLWFKR